MHLGPWYNGKRTGNQTDLYSRVARIGSTRFFHDLMENEDEWFSNLVDPATGEIFILQSDVAHPGSGNNAWAGRDVAIISDYSLETTQSITISGNKPVLRFWHQYETEAGADAGFVEVQDLADPLGQWRRITKDEAIRGGYDGAVQYGTFAIPFLYGFSGNSNGWKQSYFDLSNYAAKPSRSVSALVLTTIPHLPQAHGTSMK